MQDDNNSGKRDEDGIRAVTEVALRKLNDADAKTKEDYDKVDADDDRRKSDIVKDYAKDLEGKIPTASIAAEIVHQLVDAEKARHGKSIVSKRLIYKCLEGTKYVRQWKKQSALVHFDKKEVIPPITIGGGGGANETVFEPTNTTINNVEQAHDLSDDLASKQQTIGGGHETTPPPPSPSPPTNTEHRDSPPSDPVSEGLDAKSKQYNPNEQGATDISKSEGSTAKESHLQLHQHQQQSQLQQPSSSQSRQDFRWSGLDKVEEVYRKGLDKVAELRHKDIKNGWLCVRIENDKLLDMTLEGADINE
ncbi:MAG TPA: hypothetical protein VH593_00680 [Ktedonobacteraceae bacterium]